MRHVAWVVVSAAIAALTLACCLVSGVVGRAFQHATAAPDGFTAPDADVEGRFGFEPPPGFVGEGWGRYAQRWREDGKDFSVELQRLPSVANVADPEGELTRLWLALGVDWLEVGGKPLEAPWVLRRKLPSGALAWFAAKRLVPSVGGDEIFVWLLLVHAANRLEPVLVLQRGPPGTWDVGAPRVEAALRGVQAAPRPLPEVPELHLVGSWQPVGAASGRGPLKLFSNHEFSASTDWVPSLAKKLQLLGGASGSWMIDGQQLLLDIDGDEERFLVLGTGRGRLVLSPGTVAPHELERVGVFCVRP